MYNSTQLWNEGQVVSIEPDDDTQEFPTSGKIVGVFPGSVLVLAEDKITYVFDSRTQLATESTYENTGLRGRFFEVIKEES